nr:restriction endonuclease subunit S [Lactococcus lactis]
MGGNAFKSKDSVTEEGVRWLKIANVSNSGIKWNEESFLPSDYWERYPNYRIVAGDYVMALTRPIIAHELKIAKMPLGSNALLNQRVAKLIWNMNADFGFQLLRKRNVVDYIEQTISGTDPPNLSGNTFEKIMVSVPKTVEQEKIGRFLETVDNLLAVNQRKLDLLKEQKKGYLQKMFPKNGAKVPELRFAGFADDWEERKLGDITKISTGKLDANAMVENGKYDFYTSGIKKYRIDVAAFEGPSITIAGNGATVGYMHLADNKFNAYQRTYVLQEFLVDRSFIFSEIGNKLPKKIKQEARTGNIPYIVMDMLTELKLSIPQNNSEQEKIGSFFQQLDETIALHQRKLDLLKEQKKGFLQKMFV